MPLEHVVQPAQAGREHRGSRGAAVPRPIVSSATRCSKNAHLTRVERRRQRAHMGCQSARQVGRAHPSAWRMPTVRRRRSTANAEAHETSGASFSTSRTPGGNPSSLLAVRGRPKELCSSRSKASVSANLTNRRICFGSGESKTNAVDPVNAGGLRRECTQLPLRKWRSTEREHAVGAPSARSRPRLSPGLWQASTSISATSPGFPLSETSTLRFKPRRTRALHFRQPHRSRPNHDAAVLGADLQVRSPHDRNLAYRHVRAPGLRRCLADGCRMRRCLDERQELADPDLVIPGPCRHALPWQSGRAPTEQCGSDMSIPCQTAVSEYTILGAALN